MSGSRIGNILSGAIMLFASIVAYFWIIPTEVQMPALGGDGTARALPNLLALVIGCSSLVLIGQQIVSMGRPRNRQGESDEAGASPENPEEGEEDRYRLLWPWLLIVCAFGLAGGTAIVGFVIAATIALVALFLVFGEKDLIKVAVLSLVAPIATKAFFQYVMGVYLPASPFDVPVL